MSSVLVLFLLKTTMFCTDSNPNARILGTKATIKSEFWDVKAK